MPRPLRRARGALLRLVLLRPIAIAVGAALLIPAAWLWTGEFQWESGFTDGAALIVGASGAALVLAGVSGRRGDWTEPGEGKG